MFAGFSSGGGAAFENCLRLFSLGNDVLCFEELNWQKRNVVYRANIFRVFVHEFAIGLIERNMLKLIRKNS